MKNFFKSEWFKCVAVLLVLAVTLGGLLSVLSDVLYVSPEERAGRAIKKIYNTEMDYDTQLDIDVFAEHQPIEYKFGQINKIYKIKGSDDNHYDMLFQAVGFNGYKGGTVTVWVKVAVDKINNQSNIEKVLLENYDKQTLMSKLTNEYYAKFNLKDVTKAYQNGELFTTDTSKANSNPVSGATYSANAGINAVNCVITYIGERG